MEPVSVVAGAGLGPQARHSRRRQAPSVAMAEWGITAMVAWAVTGPATQVIRGAMATAAAILTEVGRVGAATAGAAAVMVAGEVEVVVAMAAVAAEAATGVEVVAAEVVATAKPGEATNFGRERYELELG